MTYSMVCALMGRAFRDGSQSETTDNLAGLAESSGCGDLGEGMHPSDDRRRFSTRIALAENSTEDLGGRGASVEGQARTPGERTPGSHFGSATMGKLKSLITGALIGAGGMYVGLQYHVLMAPEGVMMVPRSPQARLQDAYADIRTWDAKTWSARPRMSLAVTEYGRADLMTEGAKQGVLDKLRNTFAPEQEQLGEARTGWEPADSIDVPAPIRDSQRVAPAQDQSPVRKGFLPLADLFGFDRADTDRDIDRSILPESDSRTSVRPAGRTSPPEVEFLPAPDDIDLGSPTQFPDNLRSRPRQTDIRDMLLEQSADSQSHWEPLSLLPDDLGEQASVK